MNIILAFLTSLIVSIITVPFTIKLANKFRLVDDPNLRPHPAHLNQRIIPRAGGIPIYLAVLVASLLFLPLEKHLIGIILGISLLLAIGLIDDKRRNFNPYLRLLLMFIAAASVVGFGIGISYLTNPWYNIPNPFIDQTLNVIRLDSIIIPINFYGPHRLILIADLLAFLWIVALTQIINWSKGVDGQMPGITTVAAVTMGLFSLKLYSQGDPNQLNLAILSFITAGASLGLLIFNWYPSKILPAFSASTISAFLLAVLSILSGAKLATALLVLAIPTIDFIYTVARRILSGHSPVWGDRGHLHHKLLDLGWSHQQISLFYILGSAILGAVSLLIDTNSKLFIVLALAVCFAVFILWINSFGGLSNRPGRNNGSKTLPSLPG